MSKIKLDNEKTIIGGTEMDKKDVAYIIPVALVIIGILMLLAAQKAGWWLLGIGIVFITIIAIGNNTKKTK